MWNRVFVLGIVSGVLAFGQEALTNDGIMKLVKSGMSEDLVINLISKQPTSFSLGANDLVALKTAGVTERIITAMINRAAGPPPSAPAPGAGVPATAKPAPEGSAASLSTIKDGLLYYKKGSEYLELLTEDVNWGTKGAVKSVATAGFIKRNLRGNVTGPSSRNYLQIPFEIVISPPRGMSINDFALLPLRPGKGARDFEVGPVNRKSGVAEGAIPFGVERVGANAYRMVFQTALSPGEYGILTTKSIGGTELTRMYTFRLLL